MPASEIATPDPLPDLCELVVVDNAITWSAECWAKLAQYEIVAKQNSKIATHNTSALQKTESAYDSLHRAGILQQQLTEFYMTEAHNEKQGRFWDGMFYKALIAIGLVALP